MKKNYLAPQINVDFFSTVDVICISNGENDSSWGNLWGATKTGGFE